MDLLQINIIYQPSYQQFFLLNFIFDMYLFFFQITAVLFKYKFYAYIYLQTIFVFSMFHYSFIKN